VLVHEALLESISGHSDKTSQAVKRLLPLLSLYMSIMTNENLRLLLKIKIPNKYSDLYYLNVGTDIEVYKVNRVSFYIVTT
jgi:hypothetical protein